ncbi:MAG: hypothetical protein ACP6IP_04430 [Candidatus Njordarchaeia archaeon]
MGRLQALEVYVREIMEPTLGDLVDKRNIDIEVYDKASYIEFMADVNKIVIFVNVQDLKESLNPTFMAWKINYYFKTFPKTPINVVNSLSRFISKFGTRSAIFYMNIFVEFLSTYDFIVKTKKVPPFLIKNDLFRKYINNPIGFSYLLFVNHISQGGLAAASILFDESKLNISRIQNLLKDFIEKSRETASEGPYLPLIDPFLRFAKGIDPEGKLARRWILFRRKNYVDLFLRDVSKLDLFRMIFDVNMPRFGDYNKFYEELVQGVTGGLSESIATSAGALNLLLKKNEKREVIKTWYKLRALKELNIFLKVEEQYRDKEYGQVPMIWNVGDPVEKLDLIASLQSFPKPIPNITTKKFQAEFNRELSKIHGKSAYQNILLILDSSGSMKRPLNPEEILHEEQIKARLLGLKYPFGSKFDTALIAAFSIVEFARKYNIQISAINFSGKPIKVLWTKNYDDVEDILIEYQGKGTVFPASEVKDLLQIVSGKTLIVFISDTIVHNEEETVRTILGIDKSNSKLILFKVAPTLEENKEIIYATKKMGGTVIRINKISDLLKTLQDYEYGAPTKL